MAARPTVVVLAAGRSSRFGVGHHKLAQPLGETTVLAQTLANAIATHLRTVVVTIAAFVDVARSSVAARDVVVLPEVGSDGGSQLGMGASIAAGVGASPDSSGWLVLPGDMPMIQPRPCSRSRTRSSITRSRSRSFALGAAIRWALPPSSIPS
jgi:molybdenum cofactor cytidylyltransferase